MPNMPVHYGLLTLLVVSSTCYASSSQFSFVPNTFPNISACVNQLPTFSCENTTTITNTCCSPTPGGLVLQTQFWNTYTGFERQGQLLPKNSWTIHGLWPDNCDGCVSTSCTRYAVSESSCLDPVDRTSNIATCLDNTTRILRLRSSQMVPSYHHTTVLG